MDTQGPAKGLTVSGCLKSASLTVALKEGWLGIYMKTLTSEWALQLLSKATQMIEWGLCFFSFVFRDYRKAAWTMARKAVRVKYLHCSSVWLLFRGSCFDCNHL